MYLGIDIGTSALKVLMTADGQEAVATVSRPLATHTPREGWSEQDPVAWWDALVEACAALRAAHPAEWAAVRGLGLSGQMHGAVCLDTGLRPLRPAILWNDNRATAECADLARDCPGLADIAGVPVMPGFTLPKLVWLNRHEPEILPATAHVVAAKDYLALRLHGSAVTDMCEASGMLMLDVARRRWSETLVALAGIAPGVLPAVREGTEVGGTLSRATAAELGLPAGVPVAVGGGDAAAGAVGAGVVEAGRALISIGTSGQLLVASRHYRPAPVHLIHAFANCVPDLWLEIAALLNGARPLAWFADVAGAPVATLLEEAAVATRPPLFLPYLTGERTPHGDPDLRGGFYGLGNATTRGDMMRGVVEAVAYSFADGAAALREAGVVFADPLVVGGGARSDLLLQTLADVLGTPVHRGAGAETGPALGAARLAMVAAGAARLDEVAVAPEIARSFEPGLEAAEHHAGRLGLFRSFHQGVRSLSGQAAWT